MHTESEASLTNPLTVLVTPVLCKNTLPDAPLLPGTVLAAFDTVWLVDTSTDLHLHEVPFEHMSGPKLP